jgi:hypothetical protein
MASIHRRLRPYRQAGLYRSRTGPPSAPTPAQRQTVATLREQLVADHLHDDPTAGQSVILDLLTFAKIRHSDATSYLAAMPRPWVDRRSHRAWQVVHDLGRLERHIARLTLALVDPVLERRLAAPEDLTAYVARKDADAAKAAKQVAGDGVLDPCQPTSLPTTAAQEQGAGVGSVQSAQRGSGSS